MQIFKQSVWETQESAWKQNSSSGRVPSQDRRNSPIKGKTCREAAFKRAGDHLWRGTARLSKFYRKWEPDKWRGSLHSPLHSDFLLELPTGWTHLQSRRHVYVVHGTRLLEQRADGELIWKGKGWYLAQRHIMILQCVWEQERKIQEEIAKRNW